MLGERTSGRLTAGYVQQLAMNGGDPQVRGAGIEDDCETLWRGPDADLAIVLGLGEEQCS